MKNMRHPNFLLGIFTLVLALFGVGLKANNYLSGDYVLIIAAALAGIHYIWSIIDLVSRNDLKPFQKRFWMIAIVAVPALGSMLFYILHQERNKLTT